MAISVKTIGRSVLESMLFLALLGAGITIASNLPRLGIGSETLYSFSLPILSAFASFAVAFVFPKPTYWRAFWKFFLGALLTIGIFLILMAIVGPVIFSWMIDALWGAGSSIWDWASGNGLAAGIVAVMFYVFITVFLLAFVFAGLFALTNLLVMIGINLFIDKRNEMQDANRGSSNSSSNREEPF